MFDEKKVSVVVPVYNAESTLPLCVDSLIAQTYSNLEIILINDGSKDSSLEICQNYAERDNRIRVINKINSGVSAARNSGICAATGDYIVFCDSDDCVSSDWCKIMVDANDNENLVMCSIQRVPTDKMELIHGQCHGARKDCIKRIERKDFLFYREQGFFSPCNKIYRREIIERNCLTFPEKLSLGEDLAFVLGYLMAIPGDIYLLSDELYYYRTTGQVSLSRSVPTVEQCELFYETLTDSMNSIGVTKDDAWRLRNRIVMQDYEKRLLKIGKSKNLSFVNRWKQIKNAMDTQGYRECCGKTKISPNVIYQWMIEQRHSLLLTLYYNMK